MQQETLVTSAVLLRAIYTSDAVYAAASQSMRDHAILQWGRDHIHIVSRPLMDLDSTVWDHLAISFEHDMVIFGSNFYHHPVHTSFRKCVRNWRDDSKRSFDTQEWDEFNYSTDDAWSLQTLCQIGSEDVTYELELVLELVRFVQPGLPAGRERERVREWIRLASDVVSADSGTPSLKDFHSSIYAAYVGVVDSLTSSIRKIVPPHMACRVHKPTIRECIDVMGLGCDSLSDAAVTDAWEGLIRIISSADMVIDCMLDRAEVTTDRIVEDLNQAVHVEVFDSRSLSNMWQEWVRSLFVRPDLRTVTLTQHDMTANGTRSSVAFVGSLGDSDTEEGDESMDEGMEEDESTEEEQEE